MLKAILVLVIVLVQKSKLQMDIKNGMMEMPSWKPGIKDPEQSKSVKLNFDSVNFYMFP